MAMEMALEMAMGVSSGSLWLFMTWLRLVLIDGVVMFSRFVPSVGPFLEQSLNKIQATWKRLVVLERLYKTFKRPLKTWIKP